MEKPVAESYVGGLSPALRSEPPTELKPETLDHHNDGALAAVIAELPGEDLHGAKKPVVFHLAFTGLALVVFVFQLDATALGVALPVICPWSEHLLHCPKKLENKVADSRYFSP